MVKNDLTLLVLAGGDGTRMRPVSQITPKPLLSAFDEPLLVRQVRQAKEAGIKNILISTNPNDFDKVRSVLLQFSLKPKVLKNTTHSSGSLPALNFAINQVTTNKVLMSFADIYFIDNPFEHFKAGVNLVGTSEAFDEKELTLGGIIFVKKKRIEKIVENSIKYNSKGKRWNGLVLFSKHHKLELRKFLKSNPQDSPEGDFFEYMREVININFSSINCGDFINVNTPENLMVASMYRFAETRNDPLFHTLANQMRTRVLQKN